jgi:uncharacterized damage-inducible protein DinB
MKWLNNILLLLILPLIASKALANDFYTVELIIFTNELNVYKNEENWPNKVNLEAPTTPLFLKPITIQQAYPELSNNSENLATDAASHYLPLLGAETRQLTRAANSIKRAGRHRLLFHEAWLQKIDNKEQAQAIVIQAGNAINGFHEVAGTITLVKGRYLHINTHLWRAFFQKDGEEASVEVNLPNLAEENILAAEASSDDDELEQFIEQIEAHQQQPTVSLIGLMQQDRRMRSREIHHLDHPLFGLIIEIRPYSVDEED